MIKSKFCFQYTILYNIYFRVYSVPSSWHISILVEVFLKQGFLFPRPQRPLIYHSLSMYGLCLESALLIHFLFLCCMSMRSGSITSQTFARQDQRCAQLCGLLGPHCSRHVQDGTLRSSQGEIFDNHRFHAKVWWGLVCFLIDRDYCFLNLPKIVRLVLLLWTLCLRLLQSSPWPLPHRRFLVQWH